MLTPADSPAISGNAPIYISGPQPDASGEDRYDVDTLDQVYTVRMERQYQARRQEIIELFRLISATGTGRRMLDEIRQLSSLGIHLSIGPMASTDQGVDRARVPGVGQTRDGQPLWDCFCQGGLSMGDSPYTAPYLRIIQALTEVRNLAMAKAWPGIPPLDPRDMENAFMAELAVRTAPALAHPSFWPLDFKYLAQLDPQRPPAWNGPLTFDTLHGIVPAWVSPELSEQRDDLIDVLRRIYFTFVGERVLNELCAYARSNAIMVIHRSQRGLHGVHLVSDAKTPVWCFDRENVRELGLAPDLTDRQARAVGAFSELLSVRDRLIAKLGLLVGVESHTGVMDVFKLQIRQNWPGADNMRRTTPESSPVRNVRRAEIPNRSDSEESGAHGAGASSRSRTGRPD
jgi:hypothetical protein